MNKKRGLVLLICLLLVAITALGAVIASRARAQIPTIGVNTPAQSDAE